MCVDKWKGMMRKGRGWTIYYVYILHPQQVNDAVSQASISRPEERGFYIDHNTGDRFHLGGGGSWEPGGTEGQIEARQTGTQR